MFNINHVCLYDQLVCTRERPPMQNREQITRGDASEMDNNIFHELNCGDTRRCRAAGIITSQSMCENT